MRHFAVLLLFLGLTGSVAVAQKGKPAARPAGMLPITTSSPEARKLYDKAETEHENLYLNEAIADFRAATQKDPNFAMAYAMIAYLTKDPAEQSAARAKAKELAPKVSAGEQKVIAWITGAQENNFVPAIAAMNDIVAQYPTDPHLGFIAGRWLGLRFEFAPSERILERVTKAHPNFAPAFNELAYAYADDLAWDKALASIQRYAQLEPRQPNPQDSWGEISRMAGKYDLALQHYGAALKLVPNFANSQWGIAGTYALMGQQAKAREQFKKAIDMTSSIGDKLDFALQGASTWVREGNPDGTIKDLEQIADQAHQAGDAVRESEAHCLMAIAAADNDARAKHLKEAADVFSEKHETGKSAADEQMSRVLFLKVYYDVDPGAALQQLQDLASSSQSGLVRNDLESATGISLLRAGKAADAVPHLQEDIHNRFAQLALGQAYSKIDPEQSRQVLTVLSQWSDPGIEQAVIVPQAKQALQQK